MRLLLLSFFAGILFTACNQSNENHEHATTEVSYDSTDATNDFYDNARTYSLPHPEGMVIEGEIQGNTTQRFSKLPKRSVIIKSTLLNRKTDSFIGAYQYSGYSLYDILNSVIIDKANKERFSPIIDLYVEIYNATGEKTVLSWGEIFYPTNRHTNIIATSVTPIIPSKTNEKWPIPEQSKLIVGTDLYTERNLVNPVRIVVRSLKGNYPEKDQKTLYAPKVAIINGLKDTIEEFSRCSQEAEEISYPTVFYGRGRGIHGVTAFKGYPLKPILQQYFPITAKKIQTGMFAISAPDGYRAAFSYSEIMNRNDQSEILLIDLQKNTPDGRFRLFSSPDFFSDRAIKAVSTIKYYKIP